MRGNRQVGRPIAATGGPTAVISRDGDLLGFFASATTTVVLADANGTVLNIAACAVGWNAFPVSFLGSLTATVGSGTIYLVVG